MRLSRREALGVLLAMPLTQSNNLNWALEQPHSLIYDVQSITEIIVRWRNEERHISMQEVWDALGSNSGYTPKENPQ